MSPRPALPNGTGSLLALVLLVACRSEPWNRSVETHGSMRAVMREGDTRGRIELEQAVGRRSFGLGALAGLAGEIAVLDGEIWIGRPATGRVESAAGVRDGEQATLLALADVRRWHAETVASDLDAAALEARLAELGLRFGLGVERPWPFLLEGDFLALETHVLNGACPFAGEPPPDQQPVRASFACARGRLVGFHAPSEAGRLVHHGERTHAHVVLDTPALHVAHVDRTGLRAGGRILVPLE